MPGPRQVDAPALLHIGAGVLADIPALLRARFDLGDVMVVTGVATSSECATPTIASLEAQGSRIRRFTVSDGDTSTVTRLVEALDQRPATLVLAFGGGRPIDVAKLAASRTRVDVVAIPTVLSHDGMCSPVASLVAADGHRRSLPSATPAGIVVDIDIVGRAPVRYLRAGVGDLVSNLTAVADWRLAERAERDAVDELAASMALMAAESVLAIEWPPTPRDIETIARGLVMSGLAMEIAGSSRPCSGAEHLISHALDQRHASEALHGEQVALGTMVSSAMHPGPLHDQVRHFLTRIGFSRSTTWPWTDDQLRDAIRHAPATRPERYTVFDHRDPSRDPLEALLAGVGR